MLRTVAERAQADYLIDVHPRMAEIDHRAGAILGYPSIADANDGGVRFADLARALRAARAEIEGRDGGTVSRTRTVAAMRAGSGDGDRERKQQAGGFVTGRKGE